MTDSLQERVIAKLQKLKEMTVANGASEQEAITAAKAMRELMDQHNLTLTDIEIKQEEVIEETFDRESVYEIDGTDHCIQGLERYCGVKIWFTKRYEADFLTGHTTKVRLLSIFGRKPDTQMAHYLYEVIGEAIKQESKFLKGVQRTLFETGMATRVNERLIAMVEALEPVAKTASGSALVVVKNALVEEAFAKRGLKLKMNKYTAFTSIEGYKAGDKVRLDRPIDTKPEARGAIA